MPPAKTKRAYSKADMKAVSDNPEWTEKDFARARPFSEVLPEIAKTIARRGPQKEPTKIPVSIRLSPVVVKYFKSKGPGWQTKIDDALVEIVTKKPTNRRKAAKKSPRQAA
ncbi:BrnA antitoxin family protein [Bradyrhizobium sp. SZCCHNRI3043]|uniref:BrnA antitoxin family protein n=1 Tax=Bradyrhizobium sp. SZCCHNRI3043 TaxID=3057292 RepID=UPI0028E7B3B1|nr:BrnA antitoxin family protein [Bradyrhizobium sp. SZCCHNRI3043]